jgi:16S rRNA (adenine1518-N6/adenine1519-N6)-dimethyltransferase
LMPSMGRSKTHSEAPKRRQFAKKSLGQNFLADSSYSGRIVKSLAISPEDVVLEIGPGRGALTGMLAERAGRLTAVEIDRELVPLLRDRFASQPSVEIVEADFLELDPEDIFGPEMGGRRVKVAANLPYYISTPIIRKLFDHRYLFGDIVVMLQKEVAERITAPAGSSDRGFLTVVVEHGFASEILFDVPRSAFRPVPKVESSVVRLTPGPDGRGNTEIDRMVCELASAGFRQKRKTLRNNLRSAGEPLAGRIGSAGGIDELMRACGIEPSARAEDLTGQQWNALAEMVIG